MPLLIKRIALANLICVLFPLLVSAQEMNWKKVSANWYAAQQKTTKASAPLRVQDNIISLYGRLVELDKNGFPKQIKTFFNQKATALTDTASLLLAENIHFHFVAKRDGKNIKFNDGDLMFKQQTAKVVEWQVKSISDNVQVEVNGKLTAVGLLSYKVTVTALSDVALQDVTMHIPFQKAGATLISGLGNAGGLRPEKVEWKWNSLTEDQDVVWLGNVNAGLQYTLQPEKYINSSRKPLQLPKSWNNDGKGGITIGIKGSSMLANNYTGEHQMKKGEVRSYDFSLLITPLQLGK